MKKGAIFIIVSMIMFFLALNVYAHEIIVDDLSVRVKPGKIQLVWLHVDATSYNIYRKAETDAEFTLIANTDSTYSTYLDSDVTDGETYTYKVTCLMEGPDSEPGCGTMLVVTDLAARPKSSKVQLTWTHVGAASYNVYRKAEDEDVFTLIGNTSSDHSTYLDTGVTNGVTYTYTVTCLAESCDQEGLYSNSVSVTPIARTR